MRRLFTQFDADGSGGLDVHEFNALMVALEHPSGSTAGHGDGQSLLAKFRSLDAGGGGHLSEFELGQWLGSLPDRQVETKAPCHISVGIGMACGVTILFAGTFDRVVRTAFAQSLFLLVLLQYFTLGQARGRCRGATSAHCR